MSMQNKVHRMVETAVSNMSQQPNDVQMFANEFKQAVATLAQMMDEAAHRFDKLLRNPIHMIEKQMEQQRYMFEEAHRQKDFLERMFGDLLQEQRRDLDKLFMQQAERFEMLIELNRKSNDETQHRIGVLESVLHERLRTFEEQLINQQKTNPKPQPHNRCTMKIVLNPIRPVLCNNSNSNSNTHQNFHVWCVCSLNIKKVLSARRSTCRWS